jgi:hypothetical protein
VAARAQRAVYIRGRLLASLSCFFVSSLSFFDMSVASCLLCDSLFESLSGLPSTWLELWFIEGKP